MRSSTPVCRGWVVDLPNPRGGATQGFADDGRQTRTRLRPKISKEITVRRGLARPEGPKGQSPGQAQRRPGCWAVARARFLSPLQGCAKEMPSRAPRPPAWALPFRAFGAGIVKQGGGALEIDRTQQRHPPRKLCPIFCKSLRRTLGDVCSRQESGFSCDVSLTGGTVLRGNIPAAFGRGFVIECRSLLSPNPTT